MQLTDLSIDPGPLVGLPRSKTGSRHHRPLQHGNCSDLAAFALVTVPISNASEKIGLIWYRVVLTVDAVAYIISIAYIIAMAYIIIIVRGSCACKSGRHVHNTTGVCF